MITGAKMTRYQVHYEKAEKYWKGVIRGKRTVTARSANEAIVRVRVAVPGSFGHWVKLLANEVAV